MRPDSPNWIAAKGTETRDSVRCDALKVEDAARGPQTAESQDSPRKSGKPRQKNGGSAWESNPPATRVTCGPAVLKTVATTRCASTSA